MVKKTAFAMASKKQMPNSKSPEHEFLCQQHAMMSSLRLALRQERVGLLFHWLS
jgi:hypothetical protein